MQYEVFEEYQKKQIYRVFEGANIILINQLNLRSSIEMQISAKTLKYIISTTDNIKFM